MSNPRSGRRPRTGEKCPTCHLILPPAQDSSPEASNRPISPLAISFTDEEVSMHDESASRGVRREYITKDYERAKENVPVLKDVIHKRIDKGKKRASDDGGEGIARDIAKNIGGNVEATRSKLYWDKVCNRDIWRKVAPSSVNFTKAKERVEKAIPPMQQTFGRVLAAGINVGSAIWDSSSNIYNKNFAAAKKGQEETPFEYTSSRSESSRSSDAPYSSDDDSLLHFVNTLETDNYWTLIEVPEIDNDWNGLPEVDQMRQVYENVQTFNCQMRTFYEKQREEREARNGERTV